MERHKELAAVVRRRRTRLMISQRELADRSGVSLPSIGVIENARQDRYQTLTLRRLGSALGWTDGELARFMTDDDYELPDPGPARMLPPMPPYPTEPDDDPATPAAKKPPLELAALSGKLAELSDEDRELIESMIDRMLDED